MIDTHWPDPPGAGTSSASLQALIESAGAALAERLGIALIFLDREGRLLGANREGVRQLGRGELVSCLDGRPALRDPRAAARLVQALAFLPADGPPGAISVEASEPIAVTAGHARWLLDILPMTASRPQALALVLRPNQAVPALSQRLQSATRRYALTPAEGRVLRTLLDGCTVSRAARALGVSQATVKTHLQHIFDKTDTRRQIDLVKLLADAPPAR